MKKAFFALSLALIVLVSCKKEGDQTPEDTNETYIDASSKTTWNYYSFSDDKIVGTGEETEEDNRKWFARTDWDIAINTYTIRSNSGEATTAKANGGVYICDSSVSFNSLNALPAGAQFVTDKTVISSGMGGETRVICSEATVIVFKTDEQGNKIMPPVYLQAPVYIFRKADGKEIFKVQFTQYQNENKVSGHVKFYSKQIK